MNTSRSKTEVSSFVLHLFGRFEARVGSVPLPTIHSRQEHLLLILLTLERGKPLARSVIGTRLWSPEEHTTFRVENNLRRTLMNLRKSLGNEAFRLPDPRLMSRTLSLDLSGAEVDVLRFDDLILSGQSEALEQAIALYRGPLLMEYDEAKLLESHPGWLWILEERRKRQRAFRVAVTKLSVHAQVLGNHPLAIEYLERAVEADKLWQAGYRLLMEALSKTGKRQEALAVYGRLRRLLKREDKDSPEPAIIALYDRLRRPPRIAPTVRPTRRETDALRGNLPIAATRFIAREADTVQVVTHLQSQRLVTLTGTGGVGKTRLSQRVGEVMASTFPEGTWFVDLSALPPAADTRRVVETVLGVFPRRMIPHISDPLKGITEFLTDKSLLLILDNCEHIVEATIPVVKATLESCAGVRVLATSRQTLGMAGEIRWYVHSLPTTNPHSLPADDARWVEYVRDFPAITLFGERVAAVRPGFEITRENAQTIADICYRLDGLPYALELAAARLQSVSVAELARSLDDLFVPGPAIQRSAGARQGTLTSLIDWSYDLLQEPERNVFRRLAVFRGGWTLESAAAVCADADVSERQARPIIARLVEKSLVQFEEKNGTARYGLLETIRQYVTERLIASGEFAERKSRHLTHFADMAERAEPALRGAEQMAWFQRLEAENENLRAALEYAFGAEAKGSSENDSASETGLRLAGALWHFWEMRGAHAEGYQWLCAALNSSVGQGVERVRALAVAAVVADDMCEGSQIAPLVAEGAILARQIGDRWWTGFALLLLGWVYRPTDRAQTMAHVTEALALAREEGDPWLIAFACHVVGYHALEDENYANARNLFQEALGNVRQARDRWLLEEFVFHLGLTACGEGAYAEALRHFEECLNLQQELGTRTRSGTVRYYKAHIHFRKGERETAQELLKESLRRACEFGTRRTMTAALRALSCLAMANGQPERAAVLLGASAGLRETIDTTLLPFWDADCDASEQCTQAALGEEIFNVLSARGQIMPIEQAVAFALEKITENFHGLRKISVQENV